jgi:hypothetical protein
MTLSQMLKSKTVLFALLLAVLSVLQGFVFALPIPPWGQAAVGCAIAVAVTLLRIVTTQPLSQK